MHVPFVVLTALDVEYVAVARRLKMHTTHLSAHGTLYEIGTIDGVAGAMNVAVAEIGPGDTNAAAQAALAIEDFNPIAAFFVGVAGGIKDVRLGDVVLATKVYHYESGREESGGLMPRPDVLTTTWELQQCARAIRRETNWRPPKFADRKSFSVHVAPICAGEKVLASTRSRTYKFLRRFYSDAVAIEMEGFGFITPIRQHNVATMIIRGISDLLDRKDESDGGGSQVLAADNAASVLTELIARYARFDSLAATVEVSTRAKSGSNRQPYMGLRYFDIEDGDLYFGREQDIDDVLLGWRRGVARREGCHIAILGASGTGKSSLLRAGVLGSLRRGAIPGSKAWPQIVVRPGHRPLNSLAEFALRPKLPQLPSPDELHKQLMEDDRTLANILAAYPSERTILAVDQLEEVFTVAQDRRERDSYLANLTYAANNGASHFMLLTTLRIDQYDRFAEYPDFARVLGNHVMLAPLAITGIQAAIEQPAHLFGASFESGLVGKLLEEVGGSGELPLLQHALLELWRRRDGHLMTHRAYTEIGGISGALVQRAEAVYGSLNVVEKEACQRLFTRFSIIGQLPDLRQPIRLDDADFGDQAELYRTVAARFAAEEARLLVLGSTAVGSLPTVEVAHESLIRNWPRLQRWIDTDRDAYLLHQQLTAAAQTWRTQGRLAEYLFVGSRLAALAAWIPSYGERMDSLEREFADASLRGELNAVLDAGPQALRGRLEAWWGLGSLAASAAREMTVSSPEQERSLRLMLAALTSAEDEIAAGVRQLCLSANPGDLRLILDALDVHFLRNRDWMWDIVLSAQPSEGALVRAAASLAATSGADPRWLRVSSKLAKALLGESDLAFGDWVTSLRPLAPVLIEHLMMIATDSSASQLVRNSAVSALTGLTDEPAVLASLLVAVDGHFFDVVLQAIKRAGASALVGEALRESAGGSAASASFVMDRELRRGRAIAALLCMDRLDIVKAALEVPVTPCAVGKAVELSTNSVATDILSRTFRLSNAPHALRIVLLSLASRPRPEPNDPNLPEIIRLTQSAFAEHPAASVHAASELLLRRWGISRPNVIPREPKYRRWEQLDLDGLAIMLVHFEPGTFVMGSPATEVRREDDETQHVVEITRPFAMSDRPITVDQLSLFRSLHSDGYKLKESTAGSKAAVGVSWLEAVQFCLWLNTLLVRRADPCFDGWSFRLPTEAEWEYACRNETTTPFEFGEAGLLPRYGWFEENSDGGPMPVANLLPSSAGLFDMHGNVYEWCSDWYGPYESEAAVDPRGPTFGDRRVVRGGCWFFDSRFCRAAYRGDTRAPDTTYNDLGFRVVLSPAGT